MHCQHAAERRRRGPDLSLNRASAPQLRELVGVLDDWTEEREPRSILYPPSKKLNARVRVFIDWLTEYLIANTSH